MAWQGMDPRLERHMIPVTGGLNRWFLKHPFRGPVICFIIAGIFIGLSFIPDMGRLIYPAIFPFLIGLFLLIYALLRKALGITFVEDEDVEEEPSPETPSEADEQARQQALARWQRRARHDRHRRRNPDG
ncbi:MAG TPA: hypothetical protein G4O10_09235 [Dehalococcoidia bacterium]|nr:hypothetical protein [Dehalococcoidia bacterium]